MTDSPVVGSASFELRATRDKLKGDLAAAERDLKEATGGMEQSVTGAERGMGAAFGRIGSLAVTGIGALVAVVGLAVVGMTNLSLAGIKFGDDISKAALKIGIGTNALQEFRYVAQATGADARDADKALDSFSTKLAQAQAGTSKEAGKAFSLLGLGRDDLRQFDSVEGALDEVTDRIKDLKSEADRAAVAEALGLGPLSTALRDGAVDIAALRDEARALGVVMDAELIKRASDAQGQIDTLSQVIDVQLKSAFVDIAPAIIYVIGLVAQLARALGDALDRFKDLESKSARGLRLEREAVVRERDALVQSTPDGRVLPLDGRRVMASPVSGQRYTPLPSASTGVDGFSLAGQRPVDAGEHFNALNARAAQIDRELAQRATTDAPTRTDRPTGGSLTLPPPRTPKEAVDRSAEREARRAERVEQEIYRAKQRLLDVAEGDILTAQERWDLARDQLKMDRDARDAEIDSKEQREEYTKTEADALRLAHEQADLLEDRILTDRSILEIRDEELANARLLSDLTADLISLQSGAARTAKERAALELQLLAITQKQRRDALDQRLNSTPGLTDDDRQRAWDMNLRVESAERDAVARRNMGPLEGWRDASLRSTAEVREAYERLAVAGLDSLNDGLVDAIMNSRNLGEVFSSVARQILADLLKISIRRGVIEPLANVLFPGSAAGTQGGAGGGGNWFTSVLGSIGRGFGITPPAPVSPMAAPFDITAGLSKSAGAAGAMAARPSTIKLEIEEGAMFTARVRQVAGPMVEIGKQQAIGQSVQLARKGSAAQQQRLARLGTP